MQNETYKVKLRTNYLIEQDSRRHALTFVSIEDNVRLISQVFQQFEAKPFCPQGPSFLDHVVLKRGVRYKLSRVALGKRMKQGHFRIIITE